MTEDFPLNTDNKEDRGTKMTEIECECNWYFSVPWAPNNDGNYVHVEVEAYCEKCERTITSDYSWDVTEHFTVIEKGNKRYECDECQTEMDDEGEFRDEEEYHFCSQECHDKYWQLDEEE